MSRSYWRFVIISAVFFLGLVACTDDASFELEPDEAISETQTPEPEEGPADTSETEAEAEPDEPQTVRLRNQVGKRLGAAQQVLRTLGLRVEVQRRPSDRPTGTVLAQRPQGGRVRSGRTVTLIV